MIVNVAYPPPDALQRFRRRLAGDPDVRGLYVLNEGGEHRVWVLLGRWDRESRFRVYDAQEDADPEYLLRLRVTDAQHEIPAAAQLVR